ncbi:MAG TPA: pyruvate dehydrogenase (acetyl-transferring), homodimeric type [Candidatus Bathyarchaeia archaeon]|nr:pyruvate dehydrogenase (acetyl-transferring), homodimeric type [Candidatus Bathyarchaeia archaeon]
MDIAPLPDADPAETTEWLDSFDSVIKSDNLARARFLLARLIEHGNRHGVITPFTANTPYVNTIHVSDQPVYPGDREIERRIKNQIRWNAAAMVVQANKHSGGIGGHISTYASLATLVEVGFDHFFRAHTSEAAGDFVYFQGHAAPGVYARAFLEGRLSAGHLENFRRELAPGGGLSSYPHPWLMPEFWEFPTVSMGLSAISSIYQARFSRYLHARGLADTAKSRVWAFLGDGEMDEPESMGAITLASREQLDNLIWVVNCNLQRLDGPVRGNGKIIQELEAAFRGAGWNVIKVIWGDDWDPLLARDDEGLLVRRMGEVVDGQYQKYTVEPGAYIRKDFFGTHPKLLELVEGLTDAKLRKLRRGGHDPEKVYAAYRAAVDYRGAPTVILAKTIKGYGLGAAGEGRNISHQAKKLSERDLREFRDRLGIPINDRDLPGMPFYRPADDSEEMGYLRERRAALGGSVPRRLIRSRPLEAVPHALFTEFTNPSGGEREVATTQVFVALLRRLMSDDKIGRLIVPIVPDEARTFGMDSLFRRFGIYSQQGQRYEPVDSDIVAFYREATDGQLLEEGITEAGSMASFTAAGTAYAANGVNTIPFFLFYSMFGFQRIGDLIWQHADARGKGFLIGATAGRTTLAGEGLQHQDGHSHVLASVVPTLRAYDPAYAYEIAVIVEDGIRRMYVDREDTFYYITVMNEAYAQPAMPEGVEEGILRGLYKLRSAPDPALGPRVHLFGSGAILREALRAQELLTERGVAAEVWSVTSYSALRRDALAAERWNMLHPLEPPRAPYIREVLQAEPWPIIAATDYMKLVADQIAPFVPDGLHALGTDGFGRSETREALRRFFEVDAECICVAALAELARRDEIDAARVQQAIDELGIDPDKLEPARS